MARYFIHMAYKGTHYSGWQIQPNARSIQQTVQDAFKTLINEEISLVGAGRTDSGVHARNFYAHFDSENNFLTKDIKLIYKLNSILPQDIIIFKIKPMHSNAHARFDATQRVYKYYISNQKEIFQNEYVWQYSKPLDLNLMNEASDKLKTYTDFTSFSKLHTGVKTNNCKIFEAKWTSTNNQVVFTVCADRFLRNMVRAIVGTLIDVGRNRITMHEFIRIIELKNRSTAGSSAPACGLFLEEITYPYKI